MNEERVASDEAIGLWLAQRQSVLEIFFVNVGFCT